MKTIKVDGVDYEVVAETRLNWVIAYRNDRRLVNKKRKKLVGAEYDVKRPRATDKEPRRREKYYYDEVEHEDLAQRFRVIKKRMSYLKISELARNIGTSRQSIYQFMHVKEITGRTLAIFKKWILENE